MCRIHEEQIALSRCGIFDSTSTGRDICPVSTDNVGNGPLGMYDWTLVILLSATVMPTFEASKRMGVR